MDAKSAGAGMQADGRVGVPVTWAWRLVIAVGVLLRVQRYAEGRSLWLDESMLGLNLIQKSTRELLRSLDYVQSAPQGFLLVEKASIAVFGDSERALRLFPLLASLASVLLFMLVVRRLLPPWTALLALTLFVVNEPLLYQSSEAKPYSSDVAFALLITWLTLRALDAPSGVIGFWVVAPLAAAGFVAVWFSYPAVFVVGGAFGALLLHMGRSGRRRPILMLAAMGAVWAVSFLSLYAVSATTIATIRNAVFAGNDHAATRFSPILHAGWFSFSDPGGFLPSMRGIAFLCLVVGVIAINRSHHPKRAVLLIGPGVLAVVAAAISKYPAGERFWLFLTPALLSLIALGCSELVSASRRPLLLGLPLVIFLVGPPVGQALWHIHDTPRREHIRPLLQNLTRDWRPGDALYVYPDTQYALRYYSECRHCGLTPFPFPIRPIRPGTVNDLGYATALASSPPNIVIGSAGASPAQVLREIDALRGRKRVWLLFSHVRGSTGFDKPDLFLTYLDKEGRRLRSLREPGAALFLYDLRRGG